MSFTSMPNFKKIYEYLVPQLFKNLQKLCIPKLSMNIFGSSRQLTKNGIVDLALEI